jgi:hypothetical protein
MPGYLLHRGATVQCTHLGPAQPVSFNPRVTVGGNPVVTQSDNYAISGCEFPAWTAGNSPPCIIGSWITVATRVFAGGVPVALFDSQSQCSPNGTPMQILVTQFRVTGS